MPALALVNSMKKKKVCQRDYKIAHGKPTAPAMHKKSPGNITAAIKALQAAVHLSLQL
jgi:hypothetical protein